jgi:iron complex outermembrane receptor protein
MVKRIVMAQPMRRGALFGLVAAIAVAACAHQSCAAEARGPMDIPAQDLAGALRRLSRIGRVDLLFDPAVASGRAAAAVSGNLTVQEALDALLKGTDLVSRKTPTGGFSIVRRARLMAPDRAPPAPPSDPAVAEILVVGRRLLNVDIRRSKDDIQPYHVVSGDAVSQTQPMDLEDFLRRRTPQDAQSIAFTQAPLRNAASARSQIDLGGLGPSRTLVLVDGRRLPSVPGLDAFFQSDINALPLSAVERVEVLTATAGGIYGPGAVGGVINIVLERNYTGGQMSVESGVSGRGDAANWRAEGSFGATNKDASTRVMLTFGYAEDTGLLAGDRSYMARANQVRNIRNGAEFPLSSPSINVEVGFSNGFAPPFESAGTPPLLAHLPPSALITPAQAVAGLLANANVQDDRPPNDGNGALQSLLTRTRDVSVMFNVRRTFSPTVEFFVDYLYASDQGRASGPLFSYPFAELAPGANGNPINGDVGVGFSTTGRASVLSSATELQNLVGGLIVRLPHDWTAEVDASIGRAQESFIVPPANSASDFLQTTGVNLFAGTAALQAALNSFAWPKSMRQTFENDMMDVDLRLAGKVMMLPAGPVTMTLLAEVRREHDPAESATGENATTGEITVDKVGAQTESVASAYAELRAPLVGETSGALPWRGLEVQLAGRFDQYALSVPAPDYFTPGSGGATIHEVRGATAFTLGARSRPTPGLMLRASVATGFLPPTAAELITGKFSFQPVGDFVDLKRPGEATGDIPEFTLAWNGSPKTKSERSRSVSAGLVVTPAWAPGLRFSLDYTRIDVSDVFTTFANGDPTYIVAHEAQYPGRVTRRPLTEADRAAGYTAGLITAVDATPLSIGRLASQAVDAEIAYTRPTRIGTVTIHSQLTWRPSVRRRDEPDLGDYETVGRLDGPLALQGNVGLNWSNGPWSAGANVQVYSRYSTTLGATDVYSYLVSRLNSLLQGGRPVPAQAYLDLTFGYRWGGFDADRRAAGAEIRVGVKNLLDTQPPGDFTPLTPQYLNGGPAALGLGYSSYGDPRGRRVEVSITRRF